MNKTPTYIPRKMKTLKTIMVVSLSLMTSALADEFQAKAKKIQDLYQSGITAMKNGKGDEAKSAFEAVLKLSPKHGHARHYLKQIPAVNARVALQRRKDLFTSTTIEKIHFSDATLEEALEALSQLALEASEKKFSPNFVIQDAKKLIKNRKITLQVNNVPVSAALNYILDAAGASARLDLHATVIRPVAK